MSSTQLSPWHSPRTTYASSSLRAVGLVDAAQHRAGERQPVERAAAARVHLAPGLAKRDPTVAGGQAMGSPGPPDTRRPSGAASPPLPSWAPRFFSPAARARCSRSRTRGRRWAAASAVGWHRSRSDSGRPPGPPPPPPPPLARCRRPPRRAPPRHCRRACSTGAACRRPLHRRPGHGRPPHRDPPRRSPTQRASPRTAWRRRRGRRQKAKSGRCARAGCRCRRAA